MADTSQTVPSPLRLRRSPAEAAALVADWRASGLNKEEFSRQRGILRSALTSCLDRVLARESASPTGFIEVCPPASVNAGGGLSLEIGECLRLTGIDVSTAVTLVSALMRVRR
ncbi:MAG: hypothetical protein H0W48_14750 [Methylibium sp.]|jgi:hypothetical protein|uniref:IS66 family insertion sequence element accessory protein TnpA n=1 Tax=Methylibium sp. TaxID=2067992 RepID=UPI00182F8280|nr:hypothetical protein [Methylibium sp.]MBA3591900.1 hypothetical protein [Methylibium sp.]MBA3625674.1 hypothetical protein [Methylibium sp.]